MDRIETSAVISAQQVAPRTPYVTVSTTVTSVQREGELIDLIAVERLVNGAPVPGATVSERVAAVAVLVRRRGRTLSSAAAAVGVAPGVVLQRRPSLGGC